MARFFGEGRSRRGPTQASQRERLRELSRSTRQVLLLATVTGAATGLLVALFEKLTAEVLLDAALDLPLAAKAAVPGAGLLVAAACLRSAGRGTTSATSDEYIRAFHDPAARFDLRVVPFRLAAAIATLGPGNPLGYEGPSMYTGAAVGTAVHRRLSRFFGSDGGRVFLTAGAAAGVSAIFKAPVTGLVFALEVPYQEDLARRMLLPAAISSATSYVVFAAFGGTDPILPVAGQPPFNFVDLGGAAVIGVACGVLARLFIAITHSAKRIGAALAAPLRLGTAAIVLGGTVLVAELLGDANLALGPGYDALRWAMEAERGVVAVIALGTLRVLGTSAVLGGGGTGGLFIPLVIQGALVGRAVGGVFETDTTTLFPVIGMAAFLGAGYRVPLAAVVFVAEFTGRPGFVVPGLVAAVVAQLVMGKASISPYQVAGRVGHLEQRLQLPLTAVVDTEARTVPPDASVEELFWQHLVGTRQQSAAVVAGDTYVGLACAEDIAGVDRAAWATTPVASMARTDVTPAQASWQLRDAIRAMEAFGVDRLAVCDGDRFVGVITAAGLVQLDAVLEQSDSEGS